MCHPESGLAVSRTNALPPGAAGLGATSIDHATCCVCAHPAAHASMKTKTGRITSTPHFASLASKFVLNPLIHVAFGKLLGHANRILHGVGIGASVADDACAAYAQQRGAAV